MDPVGRLQLDLVVVGLELPGGEEEVVEPGRAPGHEEVDVEVGASAAVGDQQGRQEQDQRQRDARMDRHWRGWLRSQFRPWAYRRRVLAGLVSTPARCSS